MVDVERSWVVVEGCFHGPSVLPGVLARTEGTDLLNFIALLVQVHSEFC